MAQGKAQIEGLMGAGGSSGAVGSVGNMATSTQGTKFFAGGESALQTLIQQLLAGGTPEQQAEAARRLEEIGAVRQQRGDYSKQAAFIDAQGAVNQQSRKALEQLVPSITKAAEGAGTSASSMRALLIQDAVNKASESAAALGLKASVDYGNIGVNLSGVLQNLTSQQNPVTKALLDALNISKGSQGTSTSGANLNSGNVSGGGGVQVGSRQPAAQWSDSFLNSGWGTDRKDSMMFGVAPTAEPIYQFPNAVYGNRDFPNGLDNFNWADFGDQVAAKRSADKSGMSGVNNTWSDFTF